MARFLKVHVDTLVKKAYDNWMHVIEYDGKSLVDFNNEDAGASCSEFPMGQQEYSNIYDQQITPPSLSVPISMDQPPADSGNTNLSISNVIVIMIS